MFELLYGRKIRVSSDHIAIRTSYYSGINQRNDNVQVYGLNYVIRQLESEDSLLIVDDVHDTGISVQQIINDLKTACKKNTPEIKVATPYFKLEIWGCNFDLRSIFFTCSL